MHPDKTIAPVQMSYLNVDPSEDSIGFVKNANTPDGRVFVKDEKR
jgi:hypothetical protein